MYSMMIRLRIFLYLKKNYNSSSSPWRRSSLPTASPKHPNHTPEYEFPCSSTLEERCPRSCDHLGTAKIFRESEKDFYMTSTKSQEAWENHAARIPKGQESPFGDFPEDFVRRDA